MRTPSIPETRHSLLLRLQDLDDQRAWAEFCEIYEPLIYRLARSRGLQDADAREIVQEVFLAVTRSIERFEARESSGGFRGWLSRITRNLAINRLRQLPKMPPGGSNAWEQLKHLQDGHGDLDTSRFDIEHRRELFRWAAAKLRGRVSPKNWQAFWRTCVEGEPIADVAADLQLPVSSVYVARCRIISRMSEMIQRHTSPEAES